MPSAASRPYDAIFFDAGYTLLKPEPLPGDRYVRICRAFGGAVAGRDAMVETLRAVFQEFPQPGPDAEREAYQTSDALDRAWWRDYDGRVFARHGVPVARLDAATEAVYAYFACPDDWAVYPETVPLLDDLLARGLTLGICSNWSSGLQAVVDGLGLRGYFAFVHTSAEVGELKPGHRMFELGLDATGLPPERVLHVGDTYDADVVGARRAGIRAILVDRLRRAPDVPEPVIPDLTGLPALLG